MNINQLKIFTVVVERQGLSAAARHLNLSATAISKQIKALEDDFGVQLIYRTSTKFDVTDLGNMLYRDCKRILKDLDNLHDIAHSFQKEPSGNVAVFSTTAFADRYILPYLAEFRTLYPDVLITLDIGDRIADVQKEGIDLCFGLIRHWDGDLLQKKLFTSHPCIYATPNYLKEHGTPQSIKDLLKHKFICHGNRPDATTITFRKDIAIAVSPSIIVTSHEGFISAALQGMGLIMLFDFTAKPYEDTGELVQIRLNEELTPENFNLYYPTSPYPKPATTAFRDFITSKI